MRRIEEVQSRVSLGQQNMGPARKTRGVPFTEVNETNGRSFKLRFGTGATCRGPPMVQSRNPAMEQRLDSS